MATATDLNGPRSIERITCPDPGHHYGQILSWVICWPWNLLWTLMVHNPFRYIAVFVLREIRSTLDEIASGEFSQIERDLSDSVQGNAAAAVDIPSTNPRPIAPAYTQLPQRPAMDSTAELQTIVEADFLTTSYKPDREEPSGMETLDEITTWGTPHQISRTLQRNASFPPAPPADPDPCTAPDVLRFHRPDQRQHAPETP